MGASKTIARNDRISTAAAAMLLLLGVAIPASAQQGTGTVLGVVKDASGAVVPEVTIAITNAETGLARTVMTGVDGAFRAPALPVGRYDLRIEKTGFITATQRGLILEVAQELVVNLATSAGRRFGVSGQDGGPP